MNQVRLWRILGDIRKSKKIAYAAKPHINPLRFPSFGEYTHILTASYPKDLSSTPKNRTANKA
jgi:hypothetical protein